jgi:hypothetical protein
MSTLRVLVLIAVSAAWVGCASGGNGGGGTASEGSQASASSEASMPAGYSKPPAGSPLSKVEMGWSDEKVRSVLGSPDNANAYMTGKAWIPFYYGPDTHRTDWMYKGQGRVVYSRNRYSGALKVIRVMYNPNEMK